MNSQENTSLNIINMSYKDKLNLEVDDLTNEIMDKIRDVLAKYEQHFPAWDDDRLQTNLDDYIYDRIHDEILYTLHPPEPLEYVSPDEHLSNAYCDAIRKYNDNKEGEQE